MARLTVFDFAPMVSFLLLLCCSHSVDREPQFPDPVKVSVCDDWSGLNDRLVLVTGYIWIGIPGIWSSECPRKSLPIYDGNTVIEGRRAFDKTLWESTQIAEGHVEAEFTGTIIFNEYGGVEIDLTKIENARVIGDPQKRESY